MSAVEQMRTPSEHYKVAEFLLERLEEIAVANQYGMDAATARGMEMLLQRAQIHATLATVQPGCHDK